MFKNYFKIACRVFWRQKAYSAINIAGLALSLACCILILLYVQDELSYDKFHPQAGRVYRVVMEEKQEARARRLATTFAPMAPALRAEFPEMAQIVRLLPYNVTVARDQERRFQESRFFFVDSSFFEVFSFAWLQGEARAALRQPNALVLTAASAQKYFGDENPVGKILRVENLQDFEVTGVLQNVPHHSHFEFDFLANLNAIKAILGPWVLERGWYYPPLYTYALLAPHASAEKIAGRLPAFVQKNFPQGLATYTGLHLQPLTDIHLHSDLENEIAPTGAMAYVYVFAVIAAFILLMACINFMNLATARSATRAREVGLRKVAGAERAQLLGQFLGESLLCALLALVFALMLVEIFLPVFNTLADKRLDWNYAGNWTIGLGTLGLALLAGLLGGSYPAFFLARFRPVQVLKGKVLASTAGRAPLRLRALLVIVQFAVSAVLMIVTAVVQEQLRFVQNKRLGFEKSQLLVLPIKDEAVQQNFTAIKHGVAALPGIAHISAISNFPWEKGYYDFFVHAEGMRPGEKFNMPTLLVDYDFIAAFGMEIVAGRDFSKEHATDAQHAFILNEAAVKKWGWETGVVK